MTIATRGQNEWLVASETRPGMLYIVKRVKGQITCDCAGHFHHGHCKHADTIKATLPLRGPSAVETGNLFVVASRRRNA